MAWLPRAMNSTELGYIRSDGQGSSLYLAIHKPATVYTALINQTFSSVDKVTQVQYDTGVGTLANVLPGMTMYVGSSAGATDLGQVRIRTTPDATYFYIGENSDVPWADNLYLTVVDSFGVWPRHISIDSSDVPYMDYNIAYSDQHTHTNPIPCIGPRYIPVWLNGATVSMPFDASSSWCLSDTSISSYSWSAPGASGTSGMTTATPTITYNAVGLYRVSCQITAANGKITTAYAYVQIFDHVNNQPINQFEIKSGGGSFSDGGWKFTVTMYSQADFSSVVDRAQVVLFSRDFYGTTEVSIGQLANRENIKVVGWIDGESIVEDPDGSYIEFTVEGVHAWMKRLSGFPIGIQNATTAASAWTNWQGLTVDDSLYHLFFWQSTIIPAIDVFLTGDARVSAEQYAPGDMTIYDQLQYLLKNTLLGQAGADRFNRLFCEVDTQLTPPANRSSFPIIMTLGYTDWRDQLKITRYPVPTTSQVNLSGVSITLPNTPTAIFSLAPGHVYQHWGRPFKQDRVLLADQASSNQLAAMKLAWDNHILEFEPDLAGNNWMVDVFPSHQYVAIAVAANDTPRGFTYSGNIIVREINFSFDKSSKEDTNFLQLSWRAESETFPGNSSNGDIPVSQTSALPPLPSLPPLPPPPIINPNPGGAPQNVILVVQNHGIFYTNNFNTNDVLGPSWYAWNNGLTSSWYAGSLYHFEVSKTSGRAYLQIANVQLMTSPRAGEPWTVAATAVALAQQVNPAYLSGGMAAFGINLLADDELMVLSAWFDSLGTGHTIGQWFYGSSASLATAAVNPDDPHNIMNSGKIHYGNNKWAAYYDKYTAPLVRVNRNGTTVELYTTLCLGPTNNTLNSMRAGADNAIMYYSGDCVDFEETPDNTTTNNPITNPGFPHSLLNEYYDCDPSGAFLLAGTGTTSTYKSSDYGSTWGTLVFSNATTAMKNCGTQNDWILAASNQIWYTPDFGNSFVNKTGNLQTWLGPTFTVQALRSY